MKTKSIRKFIDHYPPEVKKIIEQTLKEQREEIVRGLVGIVTSEKERMNTAREQLLVLNKILVYIEKLKYSFKPKEVKRK